MILGRLYIAARAADTRASLLALISVHLGLLVKQKHTQLPGPGRTNEQRGRRPDVPRRSRVKAGGFFMIVFGVIALLGGLFQINPIWLFGPYKAAVVSAASQPDWYVMFLDGSTRLMPAWEIHLSAAYTIPPLFWPTVVLPGHPDRCCRCSIRSSRPKMTKDKRIHHLLQRPRDVPARTASGRDGDRVLRACCSSPAATT